jgi:hypothetical protein
MVRALGAVLMMATVTATAHGEEPGPSSSATPASEAAPPAASIDTTNAACGAQTPDADAEERAFSAELESFVRRRVFTERLLANREAEAFEQAALRQARAANLKRELTQREAAMVQREFDEAVALYLKKRELTRALAVAASRAKATPADSASAPRTNTSPTPTSPTTPPSP